jgi:hypothetical protein
MSCIRRSVVSAIVSTLTLLPSLASSAPFWGEPTTEALRLEMTGEGLAALARELQGRYLRDVDRQPIGSLERRLQNGWRVKTESLDYSVAFKGMDLRAASDGVHVDFSVNAVRLHAEAIHVSKTFFWWDLGSTCKEVDVSVKSPSELALSVTVMPDVVQEVDGVRRLSGKVTNVEFAIDPDAYVVEGPVSCSGILGFGGYLREAVSAVLGGARKQVEDIVKEQVGKLLPEALASVDRMLHEEYALDVGYPGVPLSASLKFKAEPAGIDVGDGKLVFILSSDISAVTSNDFLDGAESERMREDLPAAGTRFGVIGLNKKVINDVLQSLHPVATSEFEITPAMVPQLSDYLTTASLSAIWPDLHTVDLAGEAVRLFVSLPGVPSVEPVGDFPVVGPLAVNFAVNIPKAHVRVEVQTASGWRSYATLDLAMSMPLFLDIPEDELIVGLKDTTVISISGEWASGYSPQVDIIELDLAEAMVKTVFEALYMKGPFLRLMVPVYRFGGGMVRFVNPRTDMPFLNIDMVAM